MSVEATKTKHAKFQSAECLLCMRSRKGHLQFFMKEYDKALETYEAGLKHDPDNAELKEGIARCVDAMNKVRAPELESGRLSSLPYLFTLLTAFGDLLW